MYSLHAWTKLKKQAPVKDDVKTFTDEAAARQAWSDRTNGRDLVILYKEGQKKAVLHSARKVTA